MDEITEAAIKHAEALYKAGRKKDALKVLRGLNDPIADRILVQLEGRKKGYSRGKLAVTVLLAFVLVGVLIAAYAANDTNTRAASTAQSFAETAVMGATVSQRAIMAASDIAPSPTVELSPAQIDQTSTFAARSTRIFLTQSALATIGRETPLATLQPPRQLVSTAAPVTSVRNCEDARALGLSASVIASRYPQLDRDNDGVACYGD